MKRPEHLLSIILLIALTLSAGCRSASPIEETSSANTSRPPVQEQPQQEQGIIQAKVPLPVANSPLKQYPKVILGKENWLYYGEPMNRLQKEGLLTDAQMTNAVNELVYINNKLKEQGVHFLLLLVPDKQLIYPEFVPSMYTDMVSKQLEAYERMSQALSAADINFIDTMPILLEKRQESDIRLYYIRDNRWNPYGNFLINQEIMSHLSKEFPAPQFELISVDTSETRRVTAEIGNDLNLMMQSLLTWTEAGAPEPIYNAAVAEQPPGLLWYGDCFGAPMTDFLRGIWGDSLTYISLRGNYGFPLSFREDLGRRLEGEKVVILELVEHYRQELSGMLVPESPKLDSSWTKLYEWPADTFLSKWKPVGEYDIEATDGKVLVTANEPNSQPSFYSATPLVFPPSREYYLVIKLTSPAATGMLADFSKTTKGDFSVEWLQGQHVYKGDNTVIFKFPNDQNYLRLIKSLRIYLGDKAGTYGISEVAVYSRPR